MSEAEIIKKLKAGNLNSIEFIINKYAGSMKNYGVVHFGKTNEGVVNDCVTDTFITLIKNIKTFEYIDQKTFAGWLYKTFKNLVRNEINKKNRLKRGGDKVELNINDKIDFEDRDQNPSLTVNKIINQEMINKLLANLGTEEKAILLYFAKGYKDKEISELLGINLSALKSKKQRSLMKLREISKQYE